MPQSSPFEIVHKRMGANFGEYDGWSLPKDFGDPAAEDKALAESVAAFDLSSFGRITVKGAGGDELIAGLIKAGEAPDEGSWVCAGFDDAGGKNLRIGKIKGNYLVLTRPPMRQGIFEKMQGDADGNVLVTDVTDKTAMLGMYGPRAVVAVNNILPFDLSGIEPESITIMTFFMISITIIRGSWTGADGLEVMCPIQAAAMAASAMAKYHDRENITAAGMDCLLKAMAKGGEK